MLCWVSRIGTIGLTLCGTLAPVLPLALVPTVQPPTAVGASVGSAYGMLECLSASGQVALSLLAGLLRQAGGFRLGLRGLFACLVLSIPCTFYAQRTVATAVRAMRRVSRPRHALLAEARSADEEGLTHHPTAGLLADGGRGHDEGMCSTSSRVRPSARPFRVSTRQNSL